MRHIAVALAITLHGCSKPACADGEQNACQCADARKGTQTCGGGAYGACDCDAELRDLEKRIAAIDEQMQALLVESDAATKAGDAARGQALYDQSVRLGAESLDMKERAARLRGDDAEASRLHSIGR